MPKVRVNFQGQTFQMEGSEDDILQGIQHITGGGDFAQAQEAPYVDTQDTAPKKRGDQPMSPWMTGPTAIGEALKREEAAFAAPLNDFAKGERGIGNLGKASMDAVLGKRADQFGDALKSFGVSDVAASAGGFAMAMALPSNWLSAGSEGLTEWTPQKMQKLSKVFKMLPDEARDAASMIFGSAMSEDPRYVKEIMDNPELFNSKNLDPRNISDIKRKILSGVSELNAKGSEAIHPDRGTPLRMGQAIVDSVKQGVKDYGEQVWRPGINAVIESTKGTRVPFDVFEQAYRDLSGMTRPGASSLSATATEDIQKLYPELFNEIKSKFSKAAGASLQGESVPRSMGLSDLVSLREDLNNRLAGLYDIEGKIPAHLEKAEGFLMKLKGAVANIMDKAYTGPTGESLTAGLYGGWERLLGARDQLKRLGRGSDYQLANYISSSIFGNSPVDPMIKEALQVFDDFKLSGKPIVPMIESYQDASANSLGKLLEAVGFKTDAKNLSSPQNRKRLESVLKNFSWADSPDEVRQGLYRLSEAMPDKKKFWDQLVRHDIARKFRKPGSIFRIGAAVGVGGMRGGPLGSLAGAYSTIPPVFATANKLGAMAGRQTSFAVKEGLRRATPAILAGLMRTATQMAPNSRNPQGSSSASPPQPSPRQ